MLFLQATSDHSARLTRTLFLLESLFVKPTFRDLGMPVTKVPFTTISVDIPRRSETVANTEVRLGTAAGSRGTIEVWYT